MRVCSVISGMSDSLRPYGLYSLPGSSVHRILQVRILESTAMTSSRLSSWPRDWTCVSVFPALADRFFSTSTTWEVYTVYIGEGKLLVAVAKISPNDSDLREKFIYFSQIVSKLRVYVSGRLIFAYMCSSTSFLNILRPRTGNGHNGLCSLSIGFQPDKAYQDARESGKQESSAGQLSSNSGETSGGSNSSGRRETLSHLCLTGPLLFTSAWS